MREKIAELLYVFALSRGTQWAFLMGIAFFAMTTIIGGHLTSNLEFEGPYKALETVIGDRFMRRYDKVALIGLLSFWVLAIKCFLRDHKRYW